MVEPNEYIPGTSYLVDYCIEQYGAEVIGVEILKETRLPFPCLTGVLNTSGSYKIDNDRYPNIVAAGVDTLELNFGVNEYRQPDMFKLLNEAKLEAISAGYKGRRGIAVNMFGQEFMVQARGSRGGYEYLLNNGDIVLQMMPDARGGKPSPEIRVVFRSPYLWRIGDIAAYNEVIQFLNEFAYLDYCQTSRADLCVDMVIPLPGLNRMTEVVTLAKGKGVYYGGDYQRGQHITGYQFGRGGMSARFYDKHGEILIKGNGHILPLWEVNGWDGESPVSRLEFQLRRESLRRFDPNMDFVTFQDGKADMWAYGTNRFMRIIEPGSATRKERAQVTDYWKGYQGCAPIFGERLGVLPHKQLAPDWPPLVRQAEGCVASAFARLAADVGEAEAKVILEKECGHEIPQNVLEAGLLQKGRFTHMR